MVSPMPMGIILYPLTIVKLAISMAHPPIIPHAGSRVTPSLVLINPWIYDFAAFDLWAKPLGLLHMAAALRESGFPVHFLDCLDIHHPGLDPLGGRLPLRRLYGTGKFWRQRAARPEPLKAIRRSYSRYGIPAQLLIQELKKIPAPAAFLVTSLMTYWYPGVQEVIRICKDIHPHAPVILGGTYARLCTEHAFRNSGADRVIVGCGEEAVRAVRDFLGEEGVKTGTVGSTHDLHPYAALDLITKLEYAPLLTSTGCPYRCSYCASGFLYPLVKRREPGEVWQEILFWHGRYGIRDFVFYDDALLLGFDTHAGPLFERIAGGGLELRFHTPNALHVREIRPEVAGLLFRAGFRTIRLGLETVDDRLHLKMGNKTSRSEFEEAAANLRRAGFAKKDIGAYVLMGLPDQSVESVRETIQFADKAGATPHIAEFSPIPHTPLWEEALSSSAYDLESEPLYHNNTLLPCWDEQKKARVPELRELLRRMRMRKA